MWGHSRKIEPGTGVLIRRGICRHLHLELPSFPDSAMRNLYFLCKPSSLWSICYRSPDGLRRPFVHFVPSQQGGSHLCALLRIWLVKQLKFNRFVVMLWWILLQHLTLCAVISWTSFDLLRPLQQAWVLDIAMCFYERRWEPLGYQMPCLDPPANVQGPDPGSQSSTNAERPMRNTSVSSSLFLT